KSIIRSLAVFAVWPYLNCAGGTSSSFLKTENISRYVFNTPPIFWSFFCISSDAIVMGFNSFDMNLHPFTSSRSMRSARSMSLLYLFPILYLFEAFKAAVRLRQIEVKQKWTVFHLVFPLVRIFRTL